MNRFCNRLWNRGAYPSFQKSTLDISPYHLFFNSFPTILRSWNHIPLDKYHIMLKPWKSQFHESCIDSAHELAVTVCFLPSFKWMNSLRIKNIVDQLCHSRLCNADQTCPAHSDGRRSIQTGTTKISLVNINIPPISSCRNGSATDHY